MLGHMVKVYGNLRAAGNFKRGRGKMASVKKEAKSSKSREKRGKKQPKKPLKEANRPPCREEEAGLLSSGTEEGGEQDNALTAQEMEQVMEIVQRIQRKYVVSP